jgi:hypothetical protein
LFFGLAGSIWQLSTGASVAVPSTLYAPPPRTPAPTRYHHDPLSLPFFPSHSLVTSKQLAPPPMPGALSNPLCFPTAPLPAVSLLLQKCAFLTYLRASLFLGPPTQQPLQVQLPRNSSVPGRVRLLLLVCHSPWRVVQSHDGHPSVPVRLEDTMSVGGFGVMWKGAGNQLLALPFLHRHTYVCAL